MNQHRSGDMVSCSGVYQAHHQGHIPEHEEVTIFERQHVSGLFKMR